MDLQKALLERHGLDLICKSNTEIVVEGYPRSGSSFTCRMLDALARDHGGLNMAHHTHDALNLRLGAQLNKPLIVLVRNPAHAILSLTVFNNSDVEAAAARYRDFHQEALKLESVHFVPFEVVVTDFEAVFRLVLKLTSRQLPMPQNWDDFIQVTISDAKKRAKEIHGGAYDRRVGFPNAKREHIKEERRSKVEQYLSKSEMGAEVEELYRQCMNRSVLTIPDMT